VSRRSLRRPKTQHAALVELRRVIVLEPDYQAGEDPLAGVIGLEAFLYSARGKVKPWPWNPGHRDKRSGEYVQPHDTTMHIHADGYTTAHPGSLAADVREDPAEQLARAARLTPDELAVMREQVRGAKHYEIAAKLGMSVRAVRARVQSADKKLAELAEVVRAGGMGK
jgi:predicted DNA-binding protein (UPF0251 family)